MDVCVRPIPQERMYEPVYSLEDLRDTILNTINPALMSRMVYTTTVHGSFPLALHDIV